MSKSALLGALSAALALAAAPAVAQQVQLPPQPPYLPASSMPEPANSPFMIYPLRGSLYMISGPGGNATVSLGTDGVLIVDPGPEAAAAGLMAEIRRLSDEPLRIVMDSNGDPDHVGANHAIAVTGVALAGNNTRPSVIAGGGQTPIWASEGALNRLSALGGDPAGWPTDTFYVAHKDLFFNGEAVQLLRVPNAHTDGDVFAWFRRTDVIVAGDVFTPDVYPIIDLAHGGSIQGLLDGLNRLIDMTVPEFNLEGGTLVIPGHGRISDEADVAEFRDMATIVRDRIKDMLSRKMTLAQIQAAKPTMDYDPLYGDGRPFVEAIYKSLTAKPVKAAAEGTP